MQNFTPIGVTVANISVTRHTDINTADLTSDKTHTSVALRLSIIIHKNLLSATDVDSHGIKARGCGHIVSVIGPILLIVSA